MICNGRADIVMYLKVAADGNTNNVRRLGHLRQVRPYRVAEKFPPEIRGSLIIIREHGDFLSSHYGSGYSNVQKAWEETVLVFRSHVALIVFTYSLPVSLHYVSAFPFPEQGPHVSRM